MNVISKWERHSKCPIHSKRSLWTVAQTWRRSVIDSVSVLSVMFIELKPVKRLGKTRRFRLYHGIKFGIVILSLDCILAKAFVWNVAARAIFGYDVIVNKRYSFNRSISIEKQAERQVTLFIRSILRLVSKYSISISATLKWINTWKWLCMLDGNNRCTGKVVDQKKWKQDSMIVCLCREFSTN